MPSRIFLLGPDEWDDGFEPPLPDAVRALLRSFRAQFSPRTLREAAAELLRRRSAGRRRGVVMTPDRATAGESVADLFRRIEVEEKVDAYFLVVPMRTKVLGTVFEGGMLQRDFHYGRAPRIVLFLERGFAKEREGAYTFTAKGKRTRYLESLAESAEHVIFWDTFEELLHLIATWAEVE